MFCTNCGTKNNDEAKFCKACGKELSVTYVVKEQDTSKAGKGKNYVIGIVLVFIILILIAFTIVYLKGKRDDSNLQNNISQNDDSLSKAETAEIGTIESEAAVSDDLEAEENVENKTQIKREEKTVYFDTEDAWAGTEVSEYDQNGNLISYNTELYGFNISYDFYENGKPSVQYWYDWNGILTSEKHFDEMGNVTKDITVEYNPEEYSYSYEYDENGRIVKETTYWSDGSSLRQFEQSLVYKYDEAGNLILQSVYFDEALQKPFYTYHSEYNENGQQILYYVKNDGFDGEIGYKIEYDPVLNTEDEYCDNGYGTLYLSTHKEYSTTGELLLVRYYNENGDNTLTCQYAYDYTYDQDGNVIEQEIYLNDVLFTTIKREYY